MNGTLHQGAVAFAFSMVDPLDVFKTGVTHLTSASHVALPINALADKMLDAPSNTNWGDHKFPSQVYEDKPAWWDYFSKLYDSYTVLGVEWKLIIHNVGYKAYHDCMVMWAPETYTATDTTNKIPTANYGDVINWEGMNFKLVEGTTASEVAYGTPPYTGVTHFRVPHEMSNPEIISGRYRPGQANRLVQNDQDTKTWHKVTESPTLAEDMHVKVFSSPLSAGDAIKLNCQLDVKFIVQFKDLKSSLRYPVHLYGAGETDEGTPALVVNFPNDTLQQDYKYT